MAVMWLIPLGWSLFTALRPKADTDAYGYFSLGGAFNLDNFVHGLEPGRIPPLLCQLPDHHHPHGASWCCCSPP